MQSRSYKDALKSLSARTGAPLPSLLVSFAILHEITAVVPLVAVFYGSRSLGVGEGVVNAVLSKETSAVPSSAKGVLQSWVVEGEQWAARVGTRYGIFGFEKRTSNEAPNDLQVSSRLAGDVANAIVAYGVTKVSMSDMPSDPIQLMLAGQALIPVRIGLSLYLSPAFSRTFTEPIRTTVLQSFRRKQ